MTFTDAAAEVLRLVGRPLHYKEITDIAIEKNLLSHVGKSPEVTMGARLAATLKKDTEENPLVRVRPGVFALRAWDEKTLRGEGKKGKKAPKADAPREGAEGEGEEAAAEAVEAEGDDAPGEAEGAPGDAGDDEAAAGEPVVRAAGGDAEAGAGDDDDDSTPIFGGHRAVDSAPRALGSGVGDARASRPAWAGFDDDDDVPTGPDEAMRAEAAAGASEIFDEEEDDDQPILGGDDRPSAAGAAEAGGGRRRRRRRRGRGTLDAAPATPGTNGNGSGNGNGGLPTYTTTPVAEAREARDPRDLRDAPRVEARNGDGFAPREARDPRDSRDSRDGREPREDRRDRRDRRDREEGGEVGLRGPQIIDLSAGDATALDDLTGKDLADGIAALLATFDRNAGAVSLRQIAETAMRRGRLAGDVQLMQSQVAASVRADNARRVAQGQRPRFRFAGGRVGLTDWLLTGDLARLEQEALAAVERYRDAARRTFARKLGELPGHAFVELCVLALERIGIGTLRALRRPGSSGGEAHFTGTLRVASGDEIRLAIVIRRDGREVGRERVTELRGALHHYNTATSGWILTSGQVLTGAREESGAQNAAPVALFDGLAVAKLCEDNDVGVIRAKLPIAIPDVDLLEALRAS